MAQPKRWHAGRLDRVASSLWCSVVAGWPATKETTCRSITQVAKEMTCRSIRQVAKGMTCGSVIDRVASSLWCRAGDGAPLRLSRAQTRMNCLALVFLITSRGDQGHRCGVNPIFAYGPCITDVLTGRPERRCPGCSPPRTLPCNRRSRRSRGRRSSAQSEVIMRGVRCITIRGDQGHLMLGGAHRIANPRGLGPSCRVHSPCV